MFFQKLKREYIKTIENLICEIYDEYDIYERGSQNHISKTDLLNKILFKINNETEFLSNKSINKKICEGICKNGNRCNRLIDMDNIYCKRHLSEINEYKKQVEKEMFNESLYGYHLINNNDQDDNDDDKEDKEIIIDNKNLQKRLINDCFYLVDNKYIYDSDNYKRVGYINNKEDCNDNDSLNYIFTEDPFLLGIFK